jgi:hypothetical protein
MFLLMFFRNPTSSFVCLLYSARDVAFRLLFADNIKNNSRILAAVSATPSLCDDPFFSPILVDEECKKTVIYYPSGRSTGKEFIMTVGKPLNNPLREVEMLGESRSHEETRYLPTRVHHYRLDN